ncbi:helix-turn-helix domain-containing protein [Verrucomicrobium sp. 3C]|uniref:helix-turn-helix domain-containing protein n=1 Tax=Verrucomicrobium sp. 3C TaxID=1134055 RepID=UPI00035C5656|nr:helix-turn-helix domain-containing protein [Verrucomicrobium sp. 3C]
MKTTKDKDESPLEIEEFPAVMTKRMLAEILRVSIGTIDNWMAKGLLRAFRPTRRSVRFLRKDVIRFLKEWTDYYDGMAGR